MALVCKPTAYFLAAFNFSLSSLSVSFSPTQPPSPLAFPSPLSAPQWPSPTHSLEQCEWETACVTKAIKRTHAHIDRGAHTNTHGIHACELHWNSNTTRAHKDTNVQMPVHNTQFIIHILCSLHKAPFRRGALDLHSSQCAFHLFITSALAKDATYFQLCQLGWWDVN